MAGRPKTVSELVKRYHQREQEPLLPLHDEYLEVRDTPRALGRYGGHPITMLPRARPGGRISPSSVGGCQRQSVLKFVGMEGRRAVDHDLWTLFDDGDWRHHRWQFTFYDMEAVLGRDRFRVLGIEKRITIPELYVTGNIDARVGVRVNERWRKYTVDFKGINRRGFDWVRATDEGKDENQTQLSVYLEATGDSRGLLLYECKDTQRRLVRPVTFDTGHHEAAMKWIKQVLRALEEEKVPGRHPECRKGTMMYEGCPFKKPCWDMDGRELAKLAYGVDWRGVDAAWRAGRRALRDAERARNMSFNQTSPGSIE
jgi:hypothetical protein